MKFKKNSSFGVMSFIHRIFIICSSECHSDINGLLEIFFQSCHGICCLFTTIFFLFKKDFIYLFLERGEGREKKREKNINVWLPLMCPLPGTWPAAQACARTGNQTGDLLVSRAALNPLSHTSQGTSIFF